MGSSPSSPWAGRSTVRLDRQDPYLGILSVNTFVSDQDQRSSRLSTTLSSEVKEEALMFATHEEVKSPFRQRRRRPIFGTWWYLFLLVCGALAFTPDARAQL